MTTNYKIQVDYGTDTDSSADCSGVLFEIPDLEVVGGMDIEFILWGNSPEALLNYAILEGTSSSLGAGITGVEDPLVEVVETMDFAETYKHQAAYPIHFIDRIDAINEIWKLDAVGDVESVASAGATITSNFSRLGYSCVQELLSTPLFGSAELTYFKSPYSKRWVWTVPVNQAGAHWFFIYENSILKKKFSIAVPDLTDGTTGYKNIILRIYAKGSGVPVGLADVYVDDVLLGQTNESGEFPIQGIAEGTHTLRVLAAGFVDTEIDTLYNDEFVVY